ncbi:ABC transporter ATP-binding protein [Nocardia sp. BMG111209]|uniref:ABC transporter ATP-binding protein n=1 Tax=Nocardia sp. BMG111209 TaxID=1160137 RepID=UPI0003750345|nr:ABC transporter ATP-binding protein [Nocardia sp. BMG111209]
MSGGPTIESKSRTTTGVALGLDSISKSFGGLHVLSSVSFDVPVATIFGVAGPNGAGKTTLLNLLTGFGSFSGGRMTIGGVDATGRDARAISALGVARTFQNIRLFRGLTVREQVEAGTYRHRKAALLSSLVASPADRRDRAEIRATADEMLAFVGLSDSADRLAETMSYGDQRRIEIARALAMRPSLLLLDEPTAGMNDADWLPIANLLDRLRSEGITIVVVEHNMRLLERSCDRVAVIAAGEVIAEDEPVTCLRRPEVRRAYFGK